MQHQIICEFWQKTAAIANHPPIIKVKFPIQNKVNDKVGKRSNFKKFFNLSDSLAAVASSIVFLNLKKNKQAKLLINMSS